MKQNKLFNLIALATLGLMLTACQSLPLSVSNTNQQVEHRAAKVFIIYYDVQIGKTALLNAAKNYPAQIVYDYQNFHAIAVRVAGDVEQVKRDFGKVQGVLSVQEEQVLQLH
ncbi:MAG: hypothetical protein Q4E16_00045 [Neisseria sp.]|nr:hypothetical protein [Neisseria sp.]